MVICISTGALCGIDCKMVNVEVDLSSGLPQMEMVGSLGAEVREAQLRVRVALKNSGIALPPQHVTVNLSPASLHKEGTQYDLPIAAAILAAAAFLPAERLSGLFIAGELGLNGEVKPICGILPMMLAARQAGLCEVILPAANLLEAAVVDGMKLAAVKNLSEMIDYLKMDEAAAAAWRARTVLSKAVPSDEQLPDFIDIYGQEGLKRAMEIAAAGFHNLLMIGPPGAGKTMAAKRLPGILPPISKDEALEVSKIYSVSGLLHGGLIQNRPFVAPHHSATLQALAGGGRSPRPGLVSRAHKGVLFLDEAVHFTPAALEVLRQPMEDKKLMIARSTASYEFPAEFMLVAAINPCPCGNYPDPQRCRCTREQVQRYLGRISGPLLDRIDICVEMGRIDLDEYRKNKAAGAEYGSTAMRKRVMRARAMQETRFANTHIRFNAQMGASEIPRYVPLKGREQAFMDEVYEKLHLSLRSYHRLLKLARTIADLDGADEVTLSQLKEALCYRGVEDRYWG